MKAGEDFVDFVSRGFGKAPRPAMLRKTRTERTNAKTDAAALQGWCAAVLLKSRQVKLPRSRLTEAYDLSLARKLAQLSVQTDGIKKVGGFLGERGIVLVVLEHLPGTYLDGAAMRRDDGVPVIALTLRYDRIDNFWFTLLHEFAHVACHLDENTSMILDDLEIRSSEAIEAEADRFAQTALIPDEIWREARPDFELGDVTWLAQQAMVHPAIVAGRWQRENKDYRKFSKFLGHGDVRRILA
jgi:HTH-type transcriptional regulator/antitoxin HigA